MSVPILINKTFIYEIMEIDKHIMYFSIKLIFIQVIENIFCRFILSFHFISLIFIALRIKTHE
jgi:hypothetical protein